MRSTTLIRRCASVLAPTILAFAGLAFPSMVRAQEFTHEAAPDAASVSEPDDTPVDSPRAADEPLDLTTPEPDAGKIKALNPIRSTAPGWRSQVGMDYRKPAIPAAELQPSQLVAGAIPDQSTGVAWANLSAPGPDALLGWDKTVIETRVDPSQEGKLGTTLSRSVPIGDDVSVVLQNGLAVTRTLPSAPQQPAQSWAASQAVRFNLLPTDTSLSVGGEFSTTDDRWLPSLSAEQKLFGGPLSLTGSLSGTASGETSKSLKATFKRTW